ncbi:glycosyltransferase [Flavobacterium sp. HNIBRBA15423]|uniref:glycosyltransferase n=1 Tax=Flavobacterium sp. HNIBRBA15423 TaxID=3458683 RepID=UPI004043EA4A
MLNIAAIVVTYNREIQLIDCLMAIKNQTLSPSKLFIIDNNSSEETYNQLFSNGFITEYPEKESNVNQILRNQIQSTASHESKIDVIYVRKSENDGGAGGFYEGMKQAYDANVDWLWMMDDDGVPHQDQLKLLLEHSIASNVFFSNALVTDIDNSDLLAFNLNKKSAVAEVNKELLLKGIVAAFNGTFISRKIIEKIGFIKKEMFIWGDETEYVNRVKKNNFEIATITTAIHRHPLMKGKKENVLPFIDKYKIVIKPKRFSKYYYRNLGFNTKTYANYKAVLALFVFYLVFFIRKGDFNELMKFCKFYYKGTKNVFK